MELLTPAADVPWVKVPEFVAELQFKPLMLPGSWLTTRVIVHVRPAMLIEKLAVPLAEGVPVMV